MDRVSYSDFDELDNLPALNRENYIFETEFLAEHIPQKSKVLQVGSMDGIRAVRLLRIRLDIDFTGLDIDEDLTAEARRNVQSEKLPAQFVLGDITDPPEGLTNFDLVICLNNTLGFIPDTQKAISEMRRLGRQAYISVFGESFTDDLARQYFGQVGVHVDKITGDRFETSIGTLKRFSRHEINSWAPKNITKTPLGYMALVGLKD